MPDSESTPPTNQSPIISETLTPGEKFGDYQVMQCISAGHMGGLYRLQSIRTFEEVCAYVMPRDAMQLAAFASGPEELVARLKMARHKCLLNPESLETINGRPCLITEKIEAVNMSDYLQTFVRQKREETGTQLMEASHPLKRGVQEQLFGLPPGVVKDIALQAATGLSTLHEKGLLHLNLSPVNMLITVEGEIKLAGHGLLGPADSEFCHRLLSGGTRAPIPDGSAPPFGMQETLPPEIRAGHEPSSTADIFALGVSIFFLLTGQRPSRINLEDETSFKPPSKFSTSIPEGWDEIIHNCLDPRPEKRYQDVRTLIKEIEDVEKKTLKLAKQASKDQKGKGSRPPLPSAEEPGSALARNLEMVPVPRQIKERVSPQTLRIIRMALIGIFGLLVVGIAGYSYVALMGESEVAEGPSIRRVDAAQPANMLLNIQPPFAKAQFTGTARGALSTTDGTLRLRMPDGIYNVTIEAKDHQQTELKAIDIGRELSEYNVKLKPSYGSLQISTLPGARVIAGRDRTEPIDLGIVDDSGTLNVENKLLEGTYIVQVTRERFKPVTLEGVVIQFDKLTPVEAQLEPLPATLKVTSDPAGATISLNGQEMGPTPATISDLPPGQEIVVTLEKEGYRGITKALVFKPGADVDLDLGVLEPKAGSIKLELTFNGKPATAELLADTSLLFEDESLPANQTEIGPVPEGKRTIVVTHPDYFPFTKDVLVGDRQLTQVQAALEPRPGKLSLVMPKPVPYVLNVNGKQVTSPNGIFEFPTGQEFELVLAPQEHLIIKRTITFTPNQQEVWNVQLVPIPGPQENQPYTIPYVGMPLAWIQPGTYTMGTPAEEEARLPEEGPITTVTLSRPFWIARHEVTQAQYAVIMETNPSRFGGRSNLARPVEQISHREATEFCEKLTQRERKAGRLPEGYLFRLPTEAEWEYACRAGTSSPFNWGNNATPENANLKGAYPRALEEDEDQNNLPSYNNTIDVGQYKPNAYGLYDMHGNVSEWCYDTWKSRLSGQAETDPVNGDDNVREYVIRGGGWTDFAKRCRSGTRRAFDSKTKSPSIGFRIVCGPDLN